MTLLLQQVCIPLSDFQVEVDVELASPVTALNGPSGAGKTTLLEVIAGVRRPASAFIRLGDRVLNDTQRGVFIPPRFRGVGYVPQELALFPHLPVRGNLMYGSRRVADPRFTYEHVTDVLEIGHLADRTLTQLSGGEKQRIALGRALLAAPTILLLDEPLASLDRKLKTRILPFLQRIRDELRVPMLYVSHDLDEIGAMADEIIELESGHIVARRLAGPRVHIADQDPTHER
jgi:molybdate transport system ATP-binding protein